MSLCYRAVNMWRVSSVSEQRKEEFPGLFPRREKNVSGFQCSNFTNIFNWVLKCFLIKHLKFLFF